MFGEKVKISTSGQPWLQSAKNIDNSNHFMDGLNSQMWTVHGLLQAHGEHESRGCNPPDLGEPTR